MRMSWPNIPPPIKVYQQFESDGVLRVIDHTPFVRTGDSISVSKWDSPSIATGDLEISAQSISPDGTQTQAILSHVKHKTGGHIIGNQITTLEGEVKTQHIQVGGIKDVVTFTA
jgi:hypothetical protein